ncbi:DUF6192 family protein [Streptomyces sp. NPDC056486]|uniref:DUF6192 family protein n=1 Tax=Streptomyces sp. NPDC056486 TaxID=3345835 RepID=UPI0036BC8F1E
MSRQLREAVNKKRSIGPWRTPRTRTSDSPRTPPGQANRRVGHQVAQRVSPQEKINAIHTLERVRQTAAVPAAAALRCDRSRCLVRWGGGG